MEQPGLELALLWGVSAAGSGLTCYATAPVPRLPVLMCAPRLHWAWALRGSGAPCSVSVLKVWGPCGSKLCIPELALGLWPGHTEDGLQGLGEQLLAPRNFEHLCPWWEDGPNTQAVGGCLGLPVCLAGCGQGTLQPQCPVRVCVRFLPPSWTLNF